MLRNMVEQNGDFKLMAGSSSKPSYESIYLGKIGFNSQLGAHLVPEISDLVSSYLIPTLMYLDSMISQKENQKVANYFDSFPPAIVNQLLMQWKQTAALMYFYYLPLDQWKVEDIQMAEGFNSPVQQSKLHCLVLVKLLFAKNQQNEALGLMYNKQDYEKMSFKNLNLAGATMTGAARFRHISHDDLVDFSGVNFAGAHLTGVNFSYVFLNKANFFAANCAHGIFTEAALVDANLAKADFSDADFKKANLTNANLKQAILKNAFLGDAKFNNVDLTFSNLAYCVMHRADMRGIKLFGANLHQAKMTGVNFCDTDLSNVNFSSANVFSADFKGANLCGADLRFVTDLKLSKNFSIDNLSKAHSCFNPLLDYFKNLPVKSEFSFFNKDKSLDELVQACWLSGAKNLKDFESRYLVFIESLQTSRLSITNNFLKVLQQVRGDFRAIEMPLDLSLSLKRRGSYSG